MTLLQMRYFLTVCRLQNITHAAAELHVALRSCMSRNRR